MTLDEAKQILNVADIEDLDAIQVIAIHWGSENQICPVSEWLKEGWITNGLVFE